MIRWLAPAAACVLLALAMFNHEAGVSSHVVRKAIAPGAENPGYVSEDSSMRNRISFVTFALTNDNSGTSGVTFIRSGLLN